MNFIFCIFQKIEIQLYVMNVMFFSVHHKRLKPEGIRWYV